MKKIFKNAILILTGGLLYYGIEILWRGHSHWTMFLLGGVCFYFIGLINEIISWKMRLRYQILIGTTIITTLEFIVGCIVNLWLGWNVWDYSNVPFNILGQVCLPYILLWIPISAAAIIADDWIRYFLFHEERPHYKF